jgi:hypothetical protein
MDLPLSSPCELISVCCGSGRDEEPAGKILRLIQIRLAMSSFAKILPARQAQSSQAGTANSSVPQSESAFIRTHNETLSVVAVRVRNPGRSPV